MAYILTLTAALSADPGERALRETLASSALPPIEWPAPPPPVHTTPELGMGWRGTGVSGGSESIGGLTPRSVPPPQLSATILGELAVEAVEATMRAHQPALTACYEAALGADSLLMGEATLRLVVAADGGLSAVGFTEAGALAEALSPCIAEALEGATFQGTRAVVFLPLRFSPGR